MSGRPSMVSVRTCEPRRRASAAGRASSKKSQTCPPRPERDRSRAAGRSRAPARVQEGARVVLPAGLVEIGRQEEARLVQQQRVNTRDEWLAFGILAGEVPADDVVGHRQESTVWDTRRT